MAINVMNLVWETNLTHTENQPMFLAEQQRGEVEQQAQWQREAEDIRLAALATARVQHDPEVTGFVATMLIAERLGIARWDLRSRDWFLIRDVSQGLGGRDRQASRRGMTVGDLRRFERLRSLGPDRWAARCPAHEDRTPSLSIRRGRDWWSFHCWAGCGYWDIVRAAGLTEVDLRVAP